MGFAGRAENVGAPSQAGDAGVLRFGDHHVGVPQVVSMSERGRDVVQDEREGRAVKAAVTNEEHGPAIRWRCQHFPEQHADAGRDCRQVLAAWYARSGLVSKQPGIEQAGVGFPCFGIAAALEFAAIEFPELRPNSQRRTEREMQDLRRLKRALDGLVKIRVMFASRNAPATCRAWSRPRGVRQ